MRFLESALIAKQLLELLILLKEIQIMTLLE
jgi:hypothetical protein